MPLPPVKINKNILLKYIQDKGLKIITMLKKTINCNSSSGKFRHIQYIAIIYVIYT